jgi:glycerol-3-phosphate dehydrogenase
LIERDDFGGATSWNSHRIVHGGLRYLQGLDLGRFRTSVRERRWFLLNFPDLVEPLPCLMPLYGRGARRPGILRAALALNDVLSRRRNDGVRSDRRLESGGVMTAPETLALFPGARAEGLRGGALWYDAVMTDSQRLLMETLRWACACGARCLNYVEAVALEQDAGRVTGVVARDRATADGDELSFRASTVINCAGPWSAATARRLGGLPDDEAGRLFRPSLAFNLLFERPPPSSVALAVSAPDPDAHTWFLYPRRGNTYAGTAHFPCATNTEFPAPSEEQIEAVIAGMNAAIPALHLSREEVVRVHAGLLPATAADSAELADRPVIQAHRDKGEATGLWSISGVKYTTARDVAETTLRKAFASLAPIADDAVRPAAADLPDVRAAVHRPEGPAGEALLRFARSEAVVHVDDLILRRGPWSDDPRLERELRHGVADALSRGLRESGRAS